jgi:hypothetical protein
MIGLFYVSPIFPSDNKPNGTSTDTECLPDVLIPKAGWSKLAYGFYVIGGEFRPRSLIPVGASPFLSGISVIVAFRALEEMIRVNARRVVAAMKNALLWVYSGMEAKRNSRSYKSSLLPDVEFSVPFRASAAIPKPTLAVRLFHFCPEVSLNIQSELDGPSV